MLAVEVLDEVRRRGVTVGKDGENRLRLRPASALTPELVDELRSNKPEILRLLSEPEPVIQSAADVLALAREVLPELKDEDRVDLDELIRANSPPPPGRDPLVHRGTDKGRFFKGGWRQTWPRDYERGAS